MIIISINVGNKLCKKKKNVGNKWRVSYVVINCDIIGLKYSDDVFFYI